MTKKCKQIKANCYYALILLFTTMVAAEESVLLAAIYEADSSVELKYYRDQFDETPLPGQYSYTDMLQLRVKASGFIADNSGFGIDAFTRFNPNYNDQIVAGFDELWFQTLSGLFEYTLGYQIIDMGLMENKPIVDVLNSRDFQYDWLRPDKIGTPYITTKFLGDSNNLEFYYAPFFIPNRVPDVESGHYYPGLNTINKKNVHDKQWAIRYTYFGDHVEFGLSYMYLTQEHLFSHPNSSQFTNRRLGVELTGLYGDILLRSEVVYQNPTGDLSSGTIGAVGVEHTWQSLWGKSDLTLVYEYFFNNTDGTDMTVFEENYFSVRWAANDEALTQVELIAIGQRCDCTADVYRISLRRSINDKCTFEIQFQDSQKYFSRGDLNEDGSGWLRVKLEYSF
ncbi:hypothetical protein C9J03_00820 [Photobacterium gaetbulicola]|uniref:Porin n=1 Tax=Photobacterium gaetbulicola Gung47 TaxID=658445 RepID=A0A0C5WKQ7_9GAMM|nr:hypothetical protein [Photobacterium gaetbulicola]AJR05684.1 hypothetical protein H744_1c0659 [Photobacterium gaetbulicola Gung47]PSU14658.1 hypothetical protein C9J03_00820 [Photobacterium gaetbulicola]